MSERKTVAIVLGATLGIAAVATAVGVYMTKQAEPVVEDVNQVFERARQTVRQLDEAVDTLRKSVA